MARTSTRSTAGKRVSKLFVPDARPTDSQTERTWPTPSVAQVPPAVPAAANPLGKPRVAKRVTPKKGAHLRKAPTAAPVTQHPSVHDDSTDTRTATTVLKQEQLSPVQQRPPLFVEDLTDETDGASIGGPVTLLVDLPNRPSSTASTAPPSTYVRTPPATKTVDLTDGVPDDKTTTLSSSKVLQTPPRRKKQPTAKRSVSKLAASIDLAATELNGTPALPKPTVFWPLKVPWTPMAGKKKGKKAKRRLSGVGSAAALSPVKKNKTDLQSSVHAAKAEILARHPRAADLLAKATKLSTLRKIGRILDAKRASRKASPSKKRRSKSLHQLTEPSTTPTAAIDVPARDDDDQADHSFCPSNIFKGARAGFCFKTGPEGTGYYAEVNTNVDVDININRPRSRAPSTTGSDPVTTSTSVSKMPADLLHVTIDGDTNVPILTDLSALSVGMANIITKCSALGETLLSKNGKAYRQAMVTDESCPAKRLIAFGQSGCDKLNNMSVGATVQLTKVRVTHGNLQYARDGVQPIELQVNDFTSKDFSAVVLQSQPVANTPDHITALHAATERKDGDMINVSVMVRGRRFVDSQVPGAALSIHLLCVEEDNTAIVMTLTGAQSASFDKHTSVPVMLQASNVLVAHDGNSMHLLAVPLSILTLTDPVNVTEEQHLGSDFVCPYFVPGPNNTLEQGRLGTGRTFVSPKMLTMHAHWWPLSSIPTSTVLQVKNADSSPFAVNVVLCQVSVSKTRKGTLSVGLQVEDNTCTLWMNAYTSVLTVALSLSASELERLAASGELLTMLHEKCKGRLLLRLRLLPRLDKPAHVCIQEIVFVDDATVVV